MSKKTRQVQVGSVRIGGGAPVSVQSMTNTDTADVEKTLSQIRALTVAGADIVRVSVYNEACADAVRELEGAIHLAGFALLMGLMVLLTYKDIIRFFVKG